MKNTNRSELQINFNLVIIKLQPLSCSLSLALSFFSPSFIVRRNRSELGSQFVVNMWFGCNYLCLAAGISSIYTVVAVYTRTTTNPFKYYMHFTLFTRILGQIIRDSEHCLTLKRATQ